MTATSFGPRLRVLRQRAANNSKAVESGPPETATIKAGALGGKIMGAGGGGWFVFYVNKRKRKFRDRMAQIGLDEQRVGFDWKGTRVILNQR